MKARRTIAIPCPRLTATFRRASAAILVFLIPGVALAGNIVHLVCKGTLTQTSDTPADGTKVQTLDVSIDLLKHTIRIPQYWGCLSDSSTGRNCNDDLPVDITDDEIKLGFQLEGRIYSTGTTLTIQRHSTTMSVTTIAYAKPDSGAKWTNMFIDGDYQCEKVERQF